MELPDLVTEAMGNEEPVAQVGLGGNDAVVVTSGRTLVYRSEGILSDESVEEFPHDIERIGLTEGRRKTTFQLEYVDDTREFTVPADTTDRVLTPLLAGVLRNKGVLSEEEGVADVFRFSELTLVVAETRLLKHIGAAVWGDEYEELRYDDVTDFAVEEGNVATQLVIEVDGRPERIKTPTESSGTVRRTVEQALFAYRDVASAEELAAEAAEAEDEAAAETAESEQSADASSGSVGQEYEFDSLVGDEEKDVRAVVTTEQDVAGETEADETPPAVAQELSALREAVEQQGELLQQQQQTIEQLIEELRRGR